MIFVLFIAFLFNFPAFGSSETGSLEDFNSYLTKPYDDPTPLFILYDPELYENPEVSTRNRREARKTINNKKSENVEFENIIPSVAFVAIAISLSIFLVGITGYGMRNTATIVAVANLSAKNPIMIPSVARLNFIGPEVETNFKKNKKTQFTEATSQVGKTTQKDKISTV